MKREDLEKLDFATDPKAAIDAIMAMNGKDIEKEKKALEPLQTQVTTLSSELEAVKGQLTEAGATIEKFKGMDIEGVKKMAEDYRIAAEKAALDLKAAQDESAKAIQKKDFDYALRDALAGYGVKDADLIMPKLKPDMLKLTEDKTFIGLKEQIEPLKASHDYLFKDAKDIPRIVTGTTQQTTIPVAGAAAWKAAGLEEPK